MKIAMKLVQRISSLFPDLKKQIRTAHEKITPQEFIHNSLKFSFPFSLGMTILFFFIIDKAGLSLVLLIPAFIIIFFLTFQFSFLKLRAK